MKTFEPFTFNPEKCREELAAFKALLDGQPELSEGKDILPFFAAHRHLAAFTGSLNPNLHVFDRLATEYDLFDRKLQSMVQIAAIEAAPNPAGNP